MKRRQLLAATLVTTVGDGVFVTCSTLYLTRILGFGPLELSVVLFCVGGSGALGGVVLGRVADRVGFYRYVGFALFFMCLFIELAAYLSAPVAALAVIMLAMFMQVTGEILRGSCEWVLSFGLAPAAQHGEYQGFFNGGTAMARTVGPPVLIAVVFGLTGGAWLILGLAFLIVGFTIPGIVGWARAANHRGTDPAPRPSDA